MNRQTEPLAAVAAIEGTEHPFEPKEYAMNPFRNRVVTSSLVTLAAACDSGVAHDLITDPSGNLGSRVACGGTVAG
jgi:hypothetical protein